jgi:transcriptional regulator with XRE-family HTH domain
MHSLLESVTHLLMAARRRAGLSQSALGAKVGLAQSHISKIERGVTDLQTSNLVEIARALDLELMLVPRQLVPAVRALQQELAPSSGMDPSELDRHLDRLARRARKLVARFPELAVLTIFAGTADELRRARLDRDGAREVRPQIDAIKTILDELGAFPSDRPEPERVARGAKSAAEISSITRALQSYRNAHVHGVRNSATAPAYRLEDSDG